MIFLILLAFFQENLIPEKFKEPSGLTYSQERGTIFVVGDEGHIAELDKNGKLLKMKKMAGDSCERDFEAISIDPRNNNLLVMREPLWEIISINPENFEIESTYKLPGAPLDCKDEDWGLEALTVIEEDQEKDGWLKVLVGKQRYPAIIYEFSIPLSDKESPILNKEHKLKIESISDLYYEKETDSLWILDSWLIQRMLTSSGFHGRLFLFQDYKKIKTWHLPFPLSEGISFTPEGDLWIADDTGGIYLFEKWKEKNINF